MANKRRGLAEELVRNKPLKYGLANIDAHRFDTQRNLATDFKGNLDNISSMRSFVKEDELMIADRTKKVRSRETFLYFRTGETFIY